MPHTQQHLFGPGSLEMLRLDLWVNRSEPRDEGPPSRRIKARLVGQYDIFCGVGDMHRTHISIDDEIWTTEPGSYVTDMAAAYSGNTESAERLAGMLLVWALEEWSDPCQMTYEEALAE